MAGIGLYGRTHALLAPVVRGQVLLPRRAKRPLCGSRRVMATGEPFTPGQDSTCKVCTTRYYTLEDT